MTENKMNYNSSVNQNIKDKLVRQNIIYCASTLVWELAKNVEGFPNYYEDIINAFISEPDYEEAAKDNDWLEAEDGTFYQEDDEKDHYYLSINLQERGEISVSVHEITEPGQGSNGKIVWEFSGAEDGSENFDITDVEELREYLIEVVGILTEDDILTDDEDGEFEISDAEDWQELCETEDIDTYEYCGEILEHWIVSDWYAKKLEKYGEKILWDFFGMTVWCRRTSGQAILLDYVTGLIAEDMEILEGQKYSWAKK